jgi:hypothetical protein
MSSCPRLLGRQLHFMSSGTINTMHGTGEGLTTGIGDSGATIKADEGSRSFWDLGLSDCNSLINSELSSDCFIVGTSVSTH